MDDAVDVARALYEGVVAGDREAIAARLAPDVHWQARPRGPRGRRREVACSGADDVTASLLLVGRKLPALRPLAFQAAGDRVLVGLWADTMERRPARWWTVLTVRDGAVVAIEDHARQPTPCGRCAPARSCRATKPPRAVAAARSSRGARPP